MTRIEVTASVLNQGIGKSIATSLLLGRSVFPCVRGLKCLIVKLTLNLSQTSYNSSGTKRVDMHIEDDSYRQMSWLTRSENVTIVERLTVVNVSVICIECLAIGETYIFNSFIPSNLTGDVNFTWDFGDGTPEISDFFMESSGDAIASSSTNHS